MNAKIVQAERNSKSSKLDLLLLRRSLSWTKSKIVQGESNSKSSLLEFAIAEKLCQREHEQIHLFIAECSQLWTESTRSLSWAIANFRANEGKDSVVRLQVTVVNG